MPEILAGPVEMDAAASAEGEPEAVARRSFLEEYKTYVDSETEVLGEPPQDIDRPNDIDPPFSIGSAW
jgi:hypothetical protein